MTWIKVVPEDQAGDRLKAAIDEARSLGGGRVGNIAVLHSLNPDVVPGHVKLFRAVMYSHGDLSRAEREMVSIVVSQVNGCHY